MFYQLRYKKTTLGWLFGNDFGNKAVVSPQTLVIPIDLAEREGFEPSIGFTLRRISSAVHSTTLPPLRTLNPL